MKTYTDVIKVVKPAKHGCAEIVHDTPSPIDRIRGSMSGQPLTRSKYCRLLINGNPVMTDAEFERNTNINLLIHAKGNALIAGLGIGLILQPLLDECAAVTVIEKEADVIVLVGKSFPKANIIHADIFEWLPLKGTKYETIYFDIWPDICPDDIEQSKNLHRRFRRYLAKDGYIQSWTRIANRCVRR